MSMTVTFLVTVLSGFPIGSRTFHACVPNTRFQLNGRLCICDSLGRWSDTYCYTLERQVCDSGQIIWYDCSRCICQDNGQLSCTSLGCHDETTEKISPSLRHNFPIISPWCTPFKSYYVNCSICICPASGLTADAHCAKDISCRPHQLSSPDIKGPSYKNVCIPNVMYLFPCLHCLCSNGGFFTLDKCVETCNSLQQTETLFPINRRCIPGKFSRNNCNVCWCPLNGIFNEKYCTKATCNKRSKLRFLPNLRRQPMKCVPNSFTKPKCFYCDCSTEGNINESACLDLDCLRVDDFIYDTPKQTCSPGETVPICIECLCQRNRQTNHSYCTNGCSQESKLSVLREILKQTNKIQHLIDINLMKRTRNKYCEPNTVYMDQGNYCICPKNGDDDFKACITMPRERQIVDIKESSTDEVKEYSIHSPCEPNTFVEFDCNTCYCSKNGIIDPKWCTYDDCESKRIILEKHKAPKPSATKHEISDTCNPGSILKEDCNFCICPNNGNTNDRVCTKNICADLDAAISMEVFTCEPQAYYLVDCNICLCPPDGLKNVDKCTKNLCEKSFLRSTSCVPGELFSDDCNVCVCPPNGDKRDRVCTNHTCSEFDTPWKRIFKISQDLLAVHGIEDTTRKLDVCFRGEEFVVGCKVCVCPDVGLRAYATCTPMLCNEENGLKDFQQHEPLDEVKRENPHTRSRRLDRDGINQICVDRNASEVQELVKQCTPGSMYIIKCQQCICPYMGSITRFCRPLPEGTYCEQAYPNFNYVPMGRRTDENNTTTIDPNSTTSYVPMNHEHTKHQCSKPGKILDDCFVCECEEHDNTVIEEHCFKSNADKCKDAVPTFLKEYTIIDDE